MKDVVITYKTDTIEIVVGPGQVESVKVDEPFSLDGRQYVVRLYEPPKVNVPHGTLAWFSAA